MIPAYWTENSYNLRSFVFCLSNDNFSTIDDNRGVIRLAEFDDDSFELFQGEGIWIDNIGTVRGLSTNIYFEALGFSTKLQKVYNGDRIIRENPFSSIGSVKAGDLDVKLVNGRLQVNGTRKRTRDSIFG